MVEVNGGFIGGGNIHIDDIEANVETRSQYTKFAPFPQLLPSGLKDSGGATEDIYLSICERSREPNSITFSL